MNKTVPGLGRNSDKRHPKGRWRSHDAYASVIWALCRYVWRVLLIETDGQVFLLQLGSVIDRRRLSWKRCCRNPIQTNKIHLNRHLMFNYLFNLHYTLLWKTNCGIRKLFIGRCVAFSRPYKDADFVADTKTNIQYSSQRIVVKCNNWIFSIINGFSLKNIYNLD